jgi:hypothetical protein
VVEDSKIYKFSKLVAVTVFRQKCSNFKVITVLTRKMSRHLIEKDCIFYILFPPSELFSHFRITIFSNKESHILLTV